MTDLERTIETLQRTKSSLVVLKEDEIKTYHNSGIKDLITLLKENHKALMGASVADKAIGKVAAAIMIRAGVKEVYAEVISSFAIELFEQYGIEAKFKMKIPYIQNRDKTGICPMEEKFKDETDIDIIWQEYIA